MLTGVSTNAVFFGAATLISLAAYIGLILIPALSAYGRWPEKFAAGFLSLFIFGTLVTIGVVGGLAYVFFSNDISGIFPLVQRVSPAAAKKAKGPVALAAPVLAGRGLPGLARAAADALAMPVAFLDRSGIVLAVGGATRDQEKRLTGTGEGISTHDLAIGDEKVGEVRYLGDEADETVVEILRALAALEVERARSAEWGNESAVTELVAGLLDGSLTDADALAAAASEAGCDVSRGGGVLMVKAHSGSAREGDWWSRVVDLTVRTIRAVAPGSVAAMGEVEQGPIVAVIVPAGDEDKLLKVEEALERELPRSLSGLAVTISRSRHATGAEEFERAAREAHLALNVGEAEGRSPIAFEDTGAYRLLLGTTSEELHSFYSETVEPLVAYDDQYETDLVATVEAYLDSDANVPATAKKMFTHRHTIRYRLERIRDLSGHDATATEGRERLGLGIKAMRVLGIASPRGRSRERKTG